MLVGTCIFFIEIFVLFFRWIWSGSWSQHWRCQLLVICWRLWGCYRTGRQSSTELHSRIAHTRLQSHYVKSLDNLAGLSPLSAIAADHRFTAVSSLNSDFPIVIVLKCCVFSESWTPMSSDLLLFFCLLVFDFFLLQYF